MVHWISNPCDLGDKMKKKLFTLFSSLLFLSLPFFPLIEGESQDKITEEITVEIHALNEVTKHTKELSIEAVEELLLLMHQDNVDDLLFTMKRYGLLGNHSIGGVKELITGDYLQRTKTFEKVKDLMISCHPFNNSLLVNSFCSFRTYGFTFGFFPYNLPLLVYFLFNEKIDDMPLLNFIFMYLVFYPNLLGGYIPHITTLGLWKTYTIGRSQSASIYTKGLFGEKSIGANEDINAITVGFSGIVITIPGIIERRNAYGFALFTTAWEQT